MTSSTRKSERERWLMAMVRFQSLSDGTSRHKRLDTYFRRVGAYDIGHQDGQPRDRMIAQCLDRTRKQAVQGRRHLIEAENIKLTPARSRIHHLPYQ